MAVYVPQMQCDICMLYYESQPVGLAEVIDASEASLGGPGGQTVANVYK